MPSTQFRMHRFIEPLDVLFLRGNKLFGDPGSHGESLVPPWPSVAAGALRSHMLADAGVDLAAFAAGHVDHPSIGTPSAPGSFCITGFDLARTTATGATETLHALPADLIASRADESSPLQVQRLQPQVPAAGLLSSAPLEQWPLLAQPQRTKPVGGLWLTQAGWEAYLAGRTPTATQVVPTSTLWQLDARVGVGLDAVTRSAADGQLFSMQAVAFMAGVGFLASMEGAEPPERGTLRFGGDGRGAAMCTPNYRASAVDLGAIARAGRARLVLTTPALLADGWLLPGIEGAERRLSLPGLQARLVCAAVPRADVVSGWDLARQQPKAAQRFAPAGSVYWLADLDATADALGKLADQGLWTHAAENPQRRAEGFNRFSFAAW